jgi:glycosyltransferase involved in cell wall biosynthesis
VCRRLDQAGVSYRLIPLRAEGPTTFSRRVWRALLFQSEGILALVRRRPSGTYISLAGDWGQIYGLILLLVARLVGSRICIHHHSFSYCDRWWWLTATVVRMSGTDALHVCLCQKMTEQLRSHYGVVRTLVVPNHLLLTVNTDDQAIPSRDLSRVGYFSLVSVAKGALEFIEVARALRGTGIECVMAGPMGDQASERAIAEASGLLEYLGPLSGAEKTAFLDSLDVLLFPSSYRHEADPVAVQEALSRGVPIIYLSRGCLDETVGDAGVGLPQGTDFAASAVKTITEWRDNPGLLQQLRRSAARRTRSADGRGLASLLEWFASAQGC